MPGRQKRIGNKINKTFQTATYTTVLIYSLLNDAVSSSGYTVLNFKMIAEQWNGEDVEGKRCGLIWGTIPVFLWKEWKHQEMPQSGELISGWDLNPKSPKCKVGVLPTWPPCWVIYMYSTVKVVNEMWHSNDSENKITPLGSETL